MKRLVLVLSIVFIMFAALITPAGAVPASWVLYYGWNGGADRNIVVTSTQGWHVEAYGGQPGTVNAAMDQMTFQSDCNMVDRHYDMSKPGVAKLLYVIWSSHSVATGPCTLNWQRDGNEVIYRHDGRVLFATNTNDASQITTYRYIHQNNGWRIIDKFTGSKWVRLYATNFG